MIPFAVLAMTADTDAGTETVAADTATDIVYVSDAGSDSNSGRTPDAPFKLLSKAYATIGSNGGTIRIVGTLTNERYVISNGFWEPAHDGKIIIEGYGSSPKWHFVNANGVVTSRFYASGDTEIRNLNIHHDNGGLIGACHNTLTMGEGLTMTGSGTLYLFGGCGELASAKIPQSAHTTNDTHLIVKSGQYEAIIAGDRANNTSMCYKVGATHTLEILGDVQSDFIVLGHNGKTSAGVSANFILKGNLTNHNSKEGVAYIGGMSNYKIDHVNAYLVSGNMSGYKAIGVTYFNAGGSFTLYHNADNEGTASLATIMMNKAKANSGLTVTENSLADVCVADGHYYGDDSYCHYCNGEKPCDHANTYDNVKVVATCTVAGKFDVICNDCGTVLESDVDTGINSANHGKKHLELGEDGYDLICNDCGEVVIANATAENKIYVSDNGSVNSYGFTIDAPLSLLANAFDLLSEVGGEILIVDNIQASGNVQNTLMGSAVFVEPAHAEKITITSATDTKATLEILNVAPHYYLSGDTELTNIVIKGSMGNVIAARHNHLTMGTDLTMSYPSGVGLWVVGGCQEGVAYECDNVDTHVSFYSGNYINIIGGFRAASSAVYPHATTGTNVLEFHGDINVSGYITPANSMKAAGNVVYVINGNITTGSHFYFAGVDTNTASVMDVTIVALGGSINCGGSMAGGVTRVHGKISMYSNETADGALVSTIGSKYLVGTLSDYCINVLGAHDFGDGEFCKLCGSSAACPHADTADVVTKAPTCTETGLYNVVCNDCGVIVTSDIEIAIDADAHGIVRFFGGVDGNYDLVCDDCEYVVVENAASEPVVYVSDNGTGLYGATADDAITSLITAYEMLSRTGGTIYVVDTIVIPKTGYNDLTKGGVFTEPAHSAKITVKSAEGAAAQIVFTTDALHWYLTGDTEITDIIITSPKGSIISARHNHLTIGYNVQMQYPSGQGLWLVGGCQDGAAVECDDYGTHMTIYSGTYANIIGGFRAANNGVGYPHATTGTNVLELLGDITVNDIITPANTYGAAGDMFIVVDGNITSGSYFYFAGTNTTAGVSAGMVNNVTLLIKSGNITPGGGAGTFPGGISRVKGTVSVYYSEDAAATLVTALSKYLKGSIADYCLANGGHQYGEDSVCDTCGRLPVVLGDLDGDTALTNADIALLIRVLSGWTEKYDAEAIDVNGDLVINNRDALELIKKLVFVEE